MSTGELLGKPKRLRELTCDGLPSRSGAVEILLAASCYGKRDKLRPDEPVLAPWLHFISLECQTYNESGCTLANIWSHTLPIARAVMHAITVRLRTVASSPASIAEAGGTNTVAVVKTAIWTTDN